MLGVSGKTFKVPAIMGNQALKSCRCSDYPCFRYTVDVVESWPWWVLIGVFVLQLVAHSFSSVILVVGVCDAMLAMTGVYIERAWCQMKSIAHLKVYGINMVGMSIFYNELCAPLSVCANVCVVFI